ncbi:MAG: HU family DNA-binding protein [Desulfovibrionaceae bacterium]|nr:HU family DNA-binding protein [Desulfovibrionaceae bacterium]MBF0513651.1 HU family DNA-binding protein [Desulfovibrionaceae bacterium]
MRTIGKDDLAEGIKDKTGMPFTQAKAAVEEVLDRIKKAMAAGGEVTVRGFGTFSVKETKARAGRNPKTGEAIQIPAGKKVVFKPGKDLKF